MVTTLKFIARDLVGEFFYWPVWWYTRGLLNVLKFWYRSIREQEERLGVRIWAKNLMTPMFGQRDLEGRLISFVMRLVQIIIRFVALIVWALIVWCLVIGWVVLPLLIIYQLYRNLNGLLL